MLNVLFSTTCLVHNKTFQIIFHESKERSPEKPTISVSGQLHWATVAANGTLKNEIVQTAIQAKCTPVRESIKSSKFRVVTQSHSATGLVLY